LSESDLQLRGLVPVSFPARTAQPCWPKFKSFIPVDSGSLWHSLMIGSRPRLPTPAEPERVAPASASRSGPIPRVWCTKTALATAPFLRLGDNLSLSFIGINATRTLFSSSLSVESVPPTPKGAGAPSELERFAEPCRRPVPPQALPVKFSTANTAAP
jgi:hypothetical protein